MHPFAIVGTSIAFAAYAYLIVKTWRGEVYQNPATFILWGLLNAIAAVSMILENGNYLLTVFYGIACFAIVYATRHAGHRNRWTKREWVSAAMVVLSVVVWLVSTNEAAIIASTAGIILAGLPLMLDFWDNPRGAPTSIFVVLTVANGFALAGAADWSVEQALYPGACTIQTVVFVFLAARQRLPRFGFQPAQ